MNKNCKLTFYASELNQYNYILDNSEIKRKISLFLLKYVSVEAFYKKLLIYEKEYSGKKLSVKEKRNLRVNVLDVKRVLNFFNISCDEALVERIFGSNDKNYMECSIKKLRDRMVHSVNDKVLGVILERYDDMNRDMDDFISLFLEQHNKTIKGDTK